jgi:hypothetical protein
MSGFRFQLLRALAPSWRFFDRPGAPYVLEVRWLGGPEANIWHRPYPGVRGGLASLLFNGKANLALAWQSLVEQLVQEINDYEGEPQCFADQSVGYALVRAGLERLAPGGSFQFRITCDGELLLLSPEHASLARSS